MVSNLSHLNEEDDDNDEDSDGCYESELLDSYLAEIAQDSNLTASKFITVAELLPDHARVANDGLYRAVDIFLKVHLNIKETERCCLRKTIDGHKLSQKACGHAAQKQVSIYFEQIRLRNAMNGNPDRFFFGSTNFRTLRDQAVTDLEKDYVSMKQELVRANPANKLPKSFAKKLSKLSALLRKAASDARFIFKRGGGTSS